MRLPTLVHWSLIVVVVAAAGYGVYRYVDEFWPYRHFRTVDEGRFYRSAQLTPEDLAEAIEDYGIRTVVNLRAIGDRSEGTWYEDERRVTAESGAKHVDVPLEGGTPPSPEQVLELLAILDDPERLPVLVHCHQGTVRASSAEGLYRREFLRESGETALERVSTWGRDLESDDPKVARFILEYVPRPEANGPKKRTP